MQVISRKSLNKIKGVCGDIWEMGGTENMSVAYINITNKSKPHLHQKTEEIYYILKGRGLMIVGDARQEVEAGDLIPVAKDEFHAIEKISKEPLELLAITNPKYDEQDLIEK